MESAKIPILHHQHHHHHRHRRLEQVVLPLQDQILGSSSTSTNSSTLDQYYSAPAYASVHPSWTSNPNTILNPARLEYDDQILNQDNQLSFNWPLNAVGNNVSSFDNHQMQMSRSVLSNSCPNLSEMISSSPSSSSIEDHAQQQVLDDQHNDNVKLFLSTLSSGSGHQNNNNNHRFQSEDQFIYSSGSSSSSSLVASAPTKRATFSQIYPTINLSNINHHQDFLSSANLGGDFHQNSSFQGQLGYDDYIKQSIPRPMELPAANMSEEKGCNIKANSEPKAAGKRSRVESTRPACQPFKVRKEKLGDRIAALQQMVAPFGKTDTASVLMEAIGYIKFLQNQVETLSVPYLKSTRNKPSRAMHGGGERENDQERKRDLRSRGLCLVPMSCLSYMTDTGGAVWPPPPPSYGGAT